LLHHLQIVKRSKSQRINSSTSIGERPLSFFLYNSVAIKQYVKARLLNLALNVILSVCWRLGILKIKVLSTSDSSWSSIQNCAAVAIPLKTYIRLFLKKSEKTVAVQFGGYF